MFRKTLAASGLLNIASGLSWTSPFIPGFISYTTIYIFIHHSKLFTQAYIPFVASILRNFLVSFIFLNTAMGRMSIWPSILGCLSQTNTNISLPPNLWWLREFLQRYRFGKASVSFPLFFSSLAFRVPRFSLVPSKCRVGMLAFLSVLRNFSFFYLLFSLCSQILVVRWMSSYCVAQYFCGLSKGTGCACAPACIRVSQHLGNIQFHLLSPKTT